jgi:hypothetical protein
MNSLLDFISGLFLLPSEVFLYIFLFIIGAISLSIIVRQSRRISQEDLEASSPLLILALTYEPHPHPQPPHAAYDVVQHPEPQPNESETASSESEDQTSQSPSQISDTSAGVHIEAQPLAHPPHVSIFGPGSLQDSLIETGSVFANDNHSSFPPPEESDHESESSTSTLELSD